ncbi:hypothetical protein RIF29_39027 [Crotalaria pallida]|uniref:CTP synthase N-terminal domain-containing protein n=1 Tax=Crotalaria pallida TaxID=3830 RepID=A0AAN9E3F8_CROPI
MKYVVVTGGVVSGLGKGVTASSIGLLLKACGLRVTAIKIGYLNYLEKLLTDSLFVLDYKLKVACSNLNPATQLSPGPKFWLCLTFLEFSQQRIPAIKLSTFFKNILAPRVRQVDTPDVLL